MYTQILLCYFTKSCWKLIKWDKLPIETKT